MSGSVPRLSAKGQFNPLVQSGVPAPLLKALDTILQALSGDAAKLAAKSRGQVKADFVWPARNQITEVDEIQHFTRHRAATFSCYPESIHKGRLGEVTRLGGGQATSADRPPDPP
jgi:hypothetical protein